LPNSSTPQFTEEEVGVDPNTRKGTARFQDGVIGRYDSSSFYKANMSKNFFF